MKELRLPPLDPPLTMSHCTTSQAEAAVVACVESPNGLTKENVAEIARMTLSGDATRQRIEQSLFVRIVHPDLYQLFHIEHSLMVILQCLFIGADAFVAFFKESVYAVSSLTNYTRSPRDTDAVTPIQRMAKMVLTFLQNDGLLQRERNNSSIPKTPGTHSRAPSQPSGSVNDPNRGRTSRTWRDWTSNSIPNAPSTPSRAPSQPSSSANDPDRGRTLRTWRDWASNTSGHATTIATSTYLPTPDPSPERGSSLSEQSRFQDEEAEETGSTHDEESANVEWGDVEPVVREAMSASSSHITHDQMETIADMTFESNSRDILIDVLVDTIFAHDDATSHRPLQKALQIMKHCLYHGSSEFASWFREIRETIAILRGDRIPAVRKLAADILHQLDAGFQNNGPRTPPRSPPAPSASDFSFASSTDSTPISLSSLVKDLTAFVTTVGDHPIASGGYALIYKATLSVGKTTETVAKKILSPRNINRERLTRRINREVGAWTRLSHPNIAELYGITRETNGSIGLVSHFFESGNIDEYLKTPRPPAHVLSLMVEITLGVEYLHEHGIVHGDIKGSNIMVDEEGHAKLIDFGLSRITGESGNTTSGPGISWAFAAPELLLGDEDGPIMKTKATDVYAIAVTFVQIMSGRPPYPRMNAYAIIDAVKLRGIVPDRPMPDEPFNFLPEDDFWALLLCCWAPKPEDRPDILTLRDDLLLLDSGSS